MIGIYVLRGTLPLVNVGFYVYFTKIKGATFYSVPEEKRLFSWPKITLYTMTSKIWIFVANFDKLNELLYRLVTRHKVINLCSFWEVVSKS